MENVQKKLSDTETALVQENERKQTALNQLEAEKNAKEATQKLIQVEQSAKEAAIEEKKELENKTKMIEMKLKADKLDREKDDFMIK